jgi:hypothetical protein
MQMVSDPDLQLFNRTARLNSAVIAGALGLLAGGALWLATLVLLVRGGDQPGRHLSLLGVFFPGYTVTWSGAWIGLFWGFVFGAISGVILYWSYARGARDALAGLVLKPSNRDLLPRPTMLLSGNALGIGLGALFAAQLLASTNWLVLRGTAAYSENAALLAQYLPGYTVSFGGSIVGAVELMVAAFVGAHVLAAVYNFVARKRTR